MDAADSTVGVIGVGAMGLGVTASLCRARIRTFVRDVDEKAERAARALGAAVAASPAEVARHAAITVILVVDAPQVQEVLFGAHSLTSARASGMRRTPCRIASGIAISTFTNSRFLSRPGVNETSPLFQVKTDQRISWI